MRIAAVMTVKNEDDIIHENILYHKYIGVTDFYIYLDFSTDNTRKIVSEIPNITIKESYLPEYMLYDNSFYKYVSRYHTHHTARQIINCFDAIEIARQNSIQWMISIDSDELICLNKEDVIKNSLTQFLANLSSSIEAVTFPTIEIIPRKISYNNVFAEETFFKSPYSHGEGRRIGELAAGLNEIPEPKMLCSFNDIEYKWKDLYDIEHIYQYSTVINENFLQKVFDVPHLVSCNPSLGSQVAFDWYVGHFIGKQAFKIDRDITFKSLHRVSTNSKENEILTGYLLHYNNYSVNKFFKKYKAFSNHPETYTVGSPVDSVKIFFRDLINFSNLDEKLCAEIFYSTFVINPRMISIIDERWDGAIEIIECVKEFFLSKYLSNTNLR